MGKYFDAFVGAFMGTVDWTWKSIIFEVPWYTNYFWGLVVISLVVWGLEITFPWRKEQSIIRQDFWLDGFYMFFNFVLFPDKTQFPFVLTLKYSIHENPASSNFQADSTIRCNPKSGVL